MPRDVKEEVERILLLDLEPGDQLYDADFGRTIIFSRYLHGPLCFAYESVNPAGHGFFSFEAMHRLWRV